MHWVGAKSKKRRGTPHIHRNGGRLENPGHKSSPSRQQLQQLGDVHSDPPRFAAMGMIDLDQQREIGECGDIAVENRCLAPRNRGGLSCVQF